MGPHTDEPLCGPTERSGREVHELAFRPRGSGDGRISDNMEQSGMLCFPSILPDNEVPGENLKESAEIVIVTPAWQTQPYYPMLLNMSVSSPILLPPMPNLLLCPEGNTHPLMKTQTLKLVVWKVSGDKKKQQEFRNKLPSSWQQVGDKEHRQLTTAAGDSGVAGVTQGKLIHLTPLWSI